MSTKTISEATDIINDAQEFTLFSWSRQKGTNPIAVKHAEGVYLYDYDGNRILDFSSGLINLNIGHGNQRITEAVVKQMQQVAYVSPSCVTKVRADLGKKLAEICPGDLNKSFFTLCGATANENAIKLARLYTGRHKIITRYQSYHGATMGAISAGGDPRRIPVDVNQAPNFVHFDLPYLYRWEYGEENLLKESVAQLERIIAYEGPNTIAAILLEGESGTSGCLKYPDGFKSSKRNYKATWYITYYGRSNEWLWPHRKMVWFSKPRYCSRYDCYGKRINLRLFTFWLFTGKRKNCRKI